MWDLIPNRITQTMKKLFLILLTLIPVWLFAQPDSTVISFSHVDDPDLQLVCGLEGIQIIKLKSSDKSLEGKVINFRIDECRKGKVVRVRDFDLKNEDQDIQLEVNGKPLNYALNDINYAGYNGERDSLQITFSGKQKRGVFKLTIQFPGSFLFHTMKGKSNYRLRRVHPSASKKLTVPIGKAYPVLAYSQPFESGSSFQSYCLLDEENVGNWYRKYKVKHYYVIYLEIK